MNVYVTPIGRPFEHTLAWRVLSFLFGVIGPALIWEWIGAREFGPRPEHAVDSSPVIDLVLRGSVIFAFAQMLCLTLWLVRRPRSAPLLRAFAIIFLAGAAFAAGWSLVSLLGLLALLSVPECEMLWRSAIGFVFFSPFVCLFVYAVHARVAWSQANELRPRFKIPAWLDFFSARRDRRAGAG